VEVGAALELEAGVARECATWGREPEKEHAASNGHHLSLHVTWQSKNPTWRKNTLIG
jgi:hypothetical protein